MIGMLRGKVWETQPGCIFLDVQGVGYEVTVTATLLAKVRPGQEIMLYTRLVPKEDELCLYGFLSVQEKHLFLQMLSVSGIGPKAAMSVLSTLGAGQIESAIAAENVNLLTKVPGIGKKTAQRLILELKEKFKMFDLGNGSSLSEETTTSGSEALESLLVLGFSLEEARRVLTQVLQNQPELGVEGQIKAALRLLAKDKG